MSNPKKKSPPFVDRDSDFEKWQFIWRLTATNFPVTNCSGNWLGLKQKTPRHLPRPAGQVEPQGSTPSFKPRTQYSVRNRTTRCHWRGVFMRWHSQPAVITMRFDESD